ncbi:hypothetical protein [Microcoleus sp. A6-C5]|uniref:hypothetical protein n=1 Tax=Microcoleus sp. A6-C5 TaxID=2818547 RepID=UPI002FD2DE1B
MPQYFGKLQTTEQPWSTIDSVQSIARIDDRTIHFNCGETSLNISILAPNLVRVRMLPNPPQPPLGKGGQEMEFSPPLGKGGQQQEMEFSPPLGKGGQGGVKSRSVAGRKPSHSITLPDEEWEIVPFEVRKTEEKIEIETA